ncbi:hypothetical protein F4775DRAFT_562752 [Biscogniauxia sp. FL1348]|nr:hypothetical protein F4775DRAFT_562752 [Biscogniauxia sp. FL1348]
MIPTFWLPGLVAAAAVVSASTDEFQFFSRLLKRQEPGTPAYNCHDNCGQAIIQARQSADVCNDEIFLTDYQNCLQCSGPDNENIWRYYGNTLSNTGEQCGLSTEPLSGDQPDVGAAIAAGTSSTTSSSDEAASSTTSVASSTGVVSASTTAGSPTEATGATESTSASTPTATQESSLTSASATVSASITPTTTGGLNGTSSSTTASGTAIVTAAGNALSVDTAAFYGAMIFGALYIAQ